VTSEQNNGDNGIWTRGLLHAKQALYHWAISPADGMIQTCRGYQLTAAHGFRLMAAFGDSGPVVISHKLFVDGIAKVYLPSVRVCALCQRLMVGSSDFIMRIAANQCYVLGNESRTWQEAPWQHIGLTECHVRHIDAFVHYSSHVRTPNNEWHYTWALSRLSTKFLALASTGSFFCSIFSSHIVTLANNSKQ
jgi:hypothetical protein